MTRVMRFLSSYPGKVVWEPVHKGGTFCLEEVEVVGDLG